VKNKKHNKLVKDYEGQKAQHLEKLATKLLKISDRNDQLKTKNINIENIFNILKNDEN
jgi:hypothetical protein